MDGPTYEMNSREQLLEYLQTNGIAVLVWNGSGVMECKRCRMADKEMCMPACEEGADGPLKERIAERLVFMGFRQGQVGFNNIVEAIAVIARMRQGEQIRVTSDIYPKVAACQGSTVRNVERTIRNAIESVWKRSNLQALQEMYPYPCDNLNGRPTNAEFLINMAGRFRA